MRRILFILVCALFFAACEKEEAVKAEPEAPTEFAVVDGASPEAIAELNAKKDEIVSQVLTRHELDPEKVDVRIGAPSGLGVTVEIEGKKKVKLKVPASKFPAELVTNFDHTLDRAVRRAAGLDEK